MTASDDLLRAAPTTAAAADSRLAAAEAPVSPRIVDPALSRRGFLGGAVAGAATMGGGLRAIAATATAPAHIRKIGPSDEVRLGFIGVGVRGQQHMRYSGFAHPNDPPAMKAATSNIPRPLNVRAVAVSDCYAKRLQWAQEAVPGIKPYRDFRDLLADKDVDAIFIGTSDHNHAPVGILAASAGKHIYSEKSFANTFEECKSYRAAVKQAGVVFQLGHQTRSGTTMSNARKAIGGIDLDGAVGKVTLIECYTNRNHANGAWVYRIDMAATPETVDWAAFTGNGPKRDFDRDRFFRFRKYWDYGTGQAGDLISHEMDAIQQVTGLGIPNTATASGGVYYLRDGRETPDVLQVTYNYEKEGLLVSYTGTLGNARPREMTIFGSDGVLSLTGGLKVVADKYSDRYAQMIERGNWVVPIGELGADEAKRLQIQARTSNTTDWMLDKGIYEEMIGDKVVNVTALHVLNFVECIREGNPHTNCDIDHAFDEGVIVHMANEAYFRGRRVRWDAVREEIVNDA